MLSYQIQPTSEMKTIPLNPMVKPQLINYYENYEKYYWRYLNNSSDCNPLENLYQACYYLTMAASTDNDKARYLFRSYIPSKPMLYELSKVSSEEFLGRLKEIPRSSSYYAEAQIMAFMLQYSKRNYTVYSDYNIRLSELRSALKILMRVNSSAVIFNPAIIDFLKQLIPGFSKNISDQMLEMVIWKILVLELNGQDPLTDKINKYMYEMPESKSRSTLSTVHDYPFRLLPKKNIESFWNNSPLETKKSISTIYGSSTNKDQMNIISCTLERNAYLLSVDELKLSSTIYFVDKKNETEIARLKITEEAIFFKAYGDKIYLKFNENLNTNNLIFENPEAELNLDLQWYPNNKDPYFTSNVAHLNLQGKMQGIYPIRIDARGIIDLKIGSEIYSEGGHVAIRAKALNLSGKLRGETFCKFEIESSIEMQAESECMSRNGVIISAGSLKNIRGRIISDAFIKIDAKDSIYLHGAAHVYAKTKLTIAGKSIFATDKAIIKSDSDTRIEVKDQFIVDKEAQLSGSLVVINTKTLKNYSPYLTAKKMAIRVEEQAINYSSGIIKTEETLQLTGASVWNGGRLEFGNKLLIKLNKLFVHGVVESSQIWKLRETLQKAYLKGGDAIIIAGAVLNLLGSLEVSNLNLSSIAEFNIGVTYSRSIKKTRLLSLDLGIDVPNFREIFNDINRFCKVIEKGEFQTAINMIMTWDSAVKVSSFARWTLRNILPGFGKLADAGWSTFIFIISVPQLYHEYKALYEKEGKVENSDLYALLAKTSNLTTQAISLIPQDISAVESTVNYFSSGSDNANPVASQPLEILLPSLALDFVTLFMPVNSNEAVLEAKVGGFHSGGSLLNRTCFSFDFGCLQVGLNITDMFLYSSSQFGIHVGGHASSIGQELSRSSLVIDLMAATNVHKQKESGITLAGQMNWQSDELKENATVIADMAQVHCKSPLEHNGNFHARRIFSLEAPILNLNGTVSAYEIDLKEDNISNYLDLIESKVPNIKVANDGNLRLECKNHIVLNHEYDSLPYSVTLSGADVTVTGKIHTDNNLVLEATEGDVVTKADVISEKSLFITAKGNYINQGGNVIGLNSFIHCQDGIYNYGSLIQGRTFLYIKSDRGDIQNICAESDYQGRYDVMKNYTPGQILGGTGEGHNGVGLYMEAGKKIIYDASFSNSKGSNVIYGHQGIDITARSHGFTSFKNHEDHWLGLSQCDKEETSTQIQTSTICSELGNNIFILDENVSFNSSGGNFVNPKGHFQIIGNKDQIHLSYIKGLETKSENDSALFGLFGNNTVKGGVQVIPTSIDVRNDAEIINPFGNVVADGLYAYGPGNLKILAKDVIFSAPIINSYRLEEHSGFGIKGPDITINPLYSDLKNLIKPQSNGQRIVNTSNTIIDGVNTINNVMNGLQSANVFSTLLPIANIRVLQLNYTHNQTQTKFETVAPNVGINVGSLMIDAENLTLANGVPVSVLKDASIHTKTFNQNGALLHFDTDTHSEGISMDLSIQGNVTLAGSANRSGLSATNYFNQNFTVGGTLFLYVENWNLDCANVIAGKLAGHAGIMNIISKCGTTNSYQQSFQADSNGSFSFQNGSGRSAMIGTASSLEVLDKADFNIGIINYDGGKVLLDGPHDGFVVNTINSRPVSEFSESHSFGFGANVFDIAGSSGGRNSNQAIPSVNVSVGQHDLRARLEGTLWEALGSRAHVQSIHGTMQTKSRDGVTVLQNSSYDYEVKIPLYNSNGVKQLRDNFASLDDWLNPTRITNPVPVILDHLTQPVSIRTQNHSYYEKKSSNIDRTSDSETKNRPRKSDIDDSFIYEAERTSLRVSNGLKQPLEISARKFSLFAHENYTPSDVSNPTIAGPLSRSQQSIPSSNKLPSIYQYTSHIGRGLGEAIIDTLTMPYHLIVSATHSQMLQDDALFVAGRHLEHAIKPAADDFNEPGYLLAYKQLEHERLLYSGYDSNWMALSGPEKAESITRVLSSFLIPYGFSKLLKAPIYGPFYRGDARPFDEVFDNGFASRGTHTDLHWHAIPPDGEYSFNESVYVSTSESKEIAISFPREPIGLECSYIYEIWTKRYGFNIADELQHKVISGEINIDDFETLQKEQERAFFSRIDPSEIRGGWKVQITEIKDNAVSAWNDQIREMQEPFLSNPKYRHPHSLSFPRNLGFISVLNSLSSQEDEIAARQSYFGNRSINFFKQWDDMSIDNKKVNYVKNRS